MGTASIHEGVRRMRFSSLLERTEAKELTQEAASEMLGINVRTFQRWADRYSSEGDDGLVDRRMGRRSPKRAPEEELERMLGLFRDKYADFTVKRNGPGLPRDQQPWHNPRRGLPRLPASSRTTNEGDRSRATKTRQVQKLRTG